ncbi:iron uptake transporter deferrochelatase/peroxidase subunit [Ktedonospora formicarum]|uniref:Deferrochelatase n=1 Tax=Ktedonospora formicarum TaxID=2778364 RepID=A0A8J3I243_9CHLR|nr:iron uptake transporter deferrochelatase/peroxidase subunit [Ktedonospora formicarum]GHO46201.1 hypothetical protein KSX_43640 [Ktedonospora formicarum]
MKRFHLNRRDLLRGAGVAGTGAVLATGGYTLLQQRDAALSSSVRDHSQETVPFYGPHQAGITTPAQDHLHFATFDLLSPTLSEIRGLMRIWTSAAASMCAGKSIGEGEFNLQSPPPDTGEAMEHGPSRLTITVGFGPTFFVKEGRDRFGLAKNRPPALIDIPALPGDALKPEQSGGDLCVQACADNPQVAFHAVRNLTRLARGLAVLRWSQLGFSRTATTSKGQATPRNLMGFKDGTANIKAEDANVVRQFVWASDADGPHWMAGGSYLVARRIRIHIESWDRDSLLDQEQTIGRHKLNGAPIGGHDEFAPLDLNAKDKDGNPLIPLQSHVRLARGDDTIKLLRRGYSFTDGMDRVTGELDAGLFFISYQRDPRTQFVPLQTRLGREDALNEYITHTGSALFACPPGMNEGEYFGQSLLQ